VSLASLEDLTSERLLLDPMLHNLKVESLTSLAGGLAGEFNNLLAAISGFAQLAATRAEKPVEVRDALARIQAAAAKGTDLVSALLSFARRGSTLLESFDVARVLKNLSALLPGLAGQPILQESHATGDDFLVRGDSAQIEQALLNVLVNAADAVQGTGGKVGVEIRNVVVDSGSATDVGPGEYVSIRVTDNGEGIPVANLSRVFQPFFSTRSDGRHSGMGLAVALGIVRDHGGTMRIDSALGRGTTVTVLLPLQPSPSLLVPALVGPAQSALKDRTRILVVDDQEFVSELLRDVIETAGYAVFATTSGSDALDAIRSSRFVPHLAVVDMMMPGMDGRTLIRELRRLLPSLPVLAMSGFTQPTEGDAEIQSAVRGFVAKPFKNEHILSLVRSLAGSPEAMGRPLSGGSGP
jgi:nitrogen-specific signal transduction histidine kinase/ActR/RegA family two-component response regulator